MNEGGERIVVGVDGSLSSHRTLRWAARQAKLTGASLQVVTCWEYPTSYGWAPPYPADFDPGGDAKRILEVTVAEALGDDPGIDIDLTVVEGRPAPVLLDAARGASLLVVGSRGHGEFTGMLLGSVSEHCVGHARCPVTVVRDGGDHDGSDPS
ncbi:MAG: universal stress protein [Acidimicrobiales bacterium]|nr:universal stress protein [Acidimicrobiales bacterium]